MENSKKKTDSRVGFTIFGRDEFKMRVERTKQLMAEKQIDTLIVNDPANMHYLTGYDGWSFYVPQCVVLNLDEEDPIWIGRGIDAPGVPATTYLKEENYHFYTDNYVHADGIHPADFIVDMLRLRKLNKGTIAVELDSHYYTGAIHKRLEAGLDPGKLVDSGNLVNWIRSIKSDSEVDLMREAAEILERVMTLAIDMVNPGVRQCDLAAEIERAKIKGTESFGGDFTAITSLIPTGEHTSIPHIHWTDKELCSDELVVMELAAARHHYHCPMARTIYLGEPPEVLKNIAAAAEEGVEAALDAIAPGKKCEEIEAEFRKVLAKHGFVKSSRMGYSIGLGFPPDWGERTMSIRPGATEILEPNMTFHLMPALWGDTWGVEISQSFLVTEKGYEILGSVPRKLFVKN